MLTVKREIMSHYGYIYMRKAHMFHEPGTKRKWKFSCHDSTSISSMLRYLEYHTQVNIT